MTTPRPSATFPAVDPARDLPAAAALIRRVAAERHPYDAVLLGMAADVLDTRATRTGEPYPNEDALVEKVTTALWPDLGDRLTATRAVRVVLDEQARLRATTPGDDRGRELAERLPAFLSAPYPIRDTGSKVFREPRADEMARLVPAVLRAFAASTGPQAAPGSES